MSEPTHPESHCEEQSDAALDVFLAAAYGPDSEPPDEGVLAALGAGVGVTLRVLASAGAADASANPAAPPRYELQGEIARGGMGVVLHGRDAELGRDVAFKVLLETHKDNPALRRRFIEEARIAGQLQHPGVAPVYEMGQTADRRPCFTMKLVKGRTLADLLAERPDPKHDLPRFLKVFEQVCQTVAYAHSRGVIHRDLKPANVMVGDFGEVLVMDWGLAKVLKPGAAEAQPATAAAPDPDGGTHAGTVMGTPAYMAPEQARGETERLDERCDVFGLGAILCEILTGKPVYVSADAAELRRKAESGDLKEAMDRLDASGADEELRTLARVCLAPDSALRLRDAGRVAAAVTAHLAAVQERLRAAEVANATLEVEKKRAEATAVAVRLIVEKREREAKEQRVRRRRRLVAGAAALLIAAAFFGGWAWWKLYREPQQKQEASERFVSNLQERLAAAYMAQGKDLYVEFKWTEAAEAYRKVTKLQPDSFEAFANLGQASFHMGNTDEAEHAVDKVLELRPGARADLAAHIRSIAADLAFDADRPPESEATRAQAADAYRMVVRLTPDDADAWDGYAGVLKQQRKLAEAAAAYRKAIEQGCQDDYAMTSLSVVLAGQGRDAEAEAFFRDMVRRKADAPVPRVCLGFALLRQGKTAEGEAALDNAYHGDATKCGAAVHLLREDVVQFINSLPDVELLSRENVRLFPWSRQPIAIWAVCW